jgi:tellurite resistance protein TerA
MSSSTQLIKGQKIKLQDLTTSQIIEVGVFFNASLPVQVFCLGIDSNNALVDKRYIIFNKCEESPCGSVRFFSSGQGNPDTYAVQLATLPSTITRLVFIANVPVDGNLSQIQGCFIRLGADSKELCRFSLGGTDFKQEKAIVLGEIYLKDVWRFAAVGTGFNDGLDGLLRQFGSSPSAHQGIFDVHSISAHQNLQKVSGNIQLSKGQKPILIEKTAEIIATVSWRSGTDYDIYALVFTNECKQIDVATFGAYGVPALLNYGNGAVVHTGDVSRDGGAIKTETIRIKLNETILAVVPVVYSAQSNGTGSFYDYKVSMKIDNQQGTSVSVSADNAAQNSRIYTCVPGIIRNTPYGVVIEALELYSKTNSERRPMLIQEKGEDVKVLMDAGPINNFK